MNENKRKSFYILVFAALLLVSISLTIFLTQKKQESRSHASASTKVYLLPSTTASSPINAKVGDTVSYDVMIDPGTNLPSLIRIELNYDQTKLLASGSSAFTVNPTAFPGPVDGPV